MFNMHHITIIVKYFEESVSYYKKFGFEEFKYIEEDNIKTMVLKLDNFLLEIKYYPDVDYNTIDNKRFGLGVNSITNAKKFLEDNKLINEDIIIKTGILGKDYFFIKDPNGMLIEIIEN